jgi:hypothetical protein
VIRRAVLAVFFMAPVANAQSRADIAAAYGGTIPPQCVSAHVDLAQIAQCQCTIRPAPIVVKGQTLLSARRTCGDVIEKRAIGGLVDLGVSVMPSSIHGGDPMTVVSIKNTSNAPVPVVIGENAPWLQNALTVRSTSGADVTRAGTCGQGFSASSATFLVVLPISGVAEWRLPWAAATHVTDGACNVTWRPLPTGNYALGVALQLLQIPNATARGTMIVQ